MAIINPLEESGNAWYELSWQKNKLIIFIHRLAFEALKKVFPDEERVIALYKEDFSLPEFIYPDESNFGFGPVLKFLGLEHGQWLAWRCVLPGQDEESSEWKKKMFALRATLSLLFQKLMFLDIDTGWKNPQLVLIDSLGVGESSGGYLSAFLTPAMIQWLSRQGNCRLESVIAAMQSMDGQLVRASDCGGFRAYCRPPKWIELHVPGNACDLSPYSYSDESLDRGYQLHPHNVDNSIQQLTLLAGLACLHDLARADFHP